MALELILVLYLGLCFGSFAGALVYRIPRGLPWGSAFRASRSHCPHCKEKLRLRDLVPVFSWLFLKGRCRYCNKPIDKKYPLIELMTAFLFLVTYARLGLSVEAVPFYLSVPFLVALFFIDWEYRILPDTLVLIVGILGVIFAFLRFFVGNIDFDQMLLFHGAGLLGFASLAWLVRFFLSKAMKKEALGLGDVKFFAVAGLWLGLPLLSSFLIVAGLFGVVLGFIWQRYNNKEAAFPFGPALIVTFCLGVYTKNSFLF